jgi:hypothetical protein
VRIVIEESMYFSKGDEKRFYDGLNAVKAIKKIHGQLSELYLEVALSELHSDDMRELLALFWRYGVSLSFLKEVAVKKNFAWLRDTKKFWYKDLFK